MYLGFFGDRSSKTASTGTFQGDRDDVVAKNNADDLPLVRQLQSGNHDALTILFEKYSGMVFSIARRMLRNDSEAEEIVQQVFLDTYRAIDQFDPTKSAYKTWLFRFAYTRTINQKKYLEKRGFYVAQELDDIFLTNTIYRGLLPSSSQETKHLVRQLLQTIQPRQRVAIELTFFEGLTAQEIAKRTGETVAAVRHNLYRGLAALRAALAEGDERLEQSPEKRRRDGILLVDPA